MSLFPPKTATLVANVQSILIWSGFDFQQTLGYAEPETPLNVAFTVQNLTAQVCYIGIQYQTVNTSVGLNGGKTVASIPANSSIRIDNNQAPALSSIGPDVQNITLTLISAGAGNVIVAFEASDGAQANGIASAGQGLDARTPYDYIARSLIIANQVTSGFGQITFVVPAGKRCLIESILAEVPPTPYPAMSYAIFSCSNPSYTLSIYSLQQRHAIISMGGGLLIAESGATLAVGFQNGSVGIVVPSAFMFFREIF